MAAPTGILFSVLFDGLRAGWPGQQQCRRLFSARNLRSSSVLLAVWDESWPAQTTLILALPRVEFQLPLYPKVDGLTALGNSGLLPFGRVLRRVIRFCGRIRTEQLGLWKTFPRRLPVTESVSTLEGICSRSEPLLIPQYWSSRPLRLPILQCFSNSATPTRCFITLVRVDGLYNSSRMFPITEPAGAAAAT